MSNIRPSSVKIRKLTERKPQRRPTLRARIARGARAAKRRSYPVRERYYRLTRALRSRGTAGWLISTEATYGGYVEGVPVRRTGRCDPKSTAALRRATMAGGDRMLRHAYAPAYARRLRPFVPEHTARELAREPTRGPSRAEPAGGCRRRTTVLEIGVLHGTGLAIWCDLFPDARVVGLDIDLDPYYANVNRLHSLGAFRRNQPEVYLFDQLEPERYDIAEIIGHDTVQVCIDDGHHSNRAVLNTMHAVLPFLDQQFVYFVEDNPGVHRRIRAQFPQFAVESAGELTMVSRDADRSTLWQVSCLSAL